MRNDKQQPPDRDYIISILNYDSNTGIFIWKQRDVSEKKFNTSFANKIAGYAQKRERGFYHVISCKGKRWLAHNLAYLIVYGEWYQPLDHKDGDGLNNKIDNLVKSNKTHNSINRKLGISKSGYIGVTKYGNGQKWKASITVNKQVIELGVFVNKQDAVTARKQAEIKYGFDKIIFAREI